MWIYRNSTSWRTEYNGNRRIFYSFLSCSWNPIEITLFVLRCFFICSPFYWSSFWCCTSFYHGASFCPFSLGLIYDLFHCGCPQHFPLYFERKICVWWRWDPNLFEAMADARLEQWLEENWRQLNQSCLECVEYPTPVCLQKIANPRNHKQEWQLVNIHKSEAIHHLHGIDCLFPLFVSWKVHFGNSVEFMVDLLTKNEVNSLKLECCNLFCRKLQFFSAIFCDPNGLKSLGFVRRYRKIHQGSFLDQKYLSVRRENSEHFDTSKHEV